MTLSRILEDCKYFEIQRFKSKFTNIELINRLGFNLNLIEKLYGYSHNFTHEELIKLTNQLKYLQSSKIIETLTLIKFNFNSTVNLSEDLIKIYETIILQKTLFQTFLNMGLVDPIITIRLNEQEISLKELFIIACENGHLEIVKYYYTEKFLRYKDNIAFKLSCKNGHFDVMVFIDSLEWSEPKNYYYKIGFDLACQYNHKKIVKYLLLKNNENIYFDMTSGFKNACKNNNLEIAQFIYFKEKNITIEDLQFIFTVCCIRGYVDIIQWIHSLQQINIEFLITLNQNYLFNKICENKHMELAQWIYFMFGYNIDEKYVNIHFKILNLNKKRYIDELIEKMVICF